jgi:VWFA-related protein
MNRRLALSLLLLSTALAGAAAQEEQPPAAGETAASTVEERVKVQLVELKISVRDKLGSPVTDITPDEVRVFENGREQRLAFFEAVAERGLVTVGSDDSPQPVPLYDTSGEASQGEAEMVLPPKPVRRIFFVFDPRNSRTPVREGWKNAAVCWASEHMQDGDQAGVIVLRQYPEWAGPLTSEKAQLLVALRTLDLYTNIPDRNRRQEMTEFMESFRSLCVDNKRDFRFTERGSEGARAADLAADELECVYNMSRPMAHEWKQQSKESLEVLQFVAGQLAAIPGEKIVVLFSEGIIDDPAQVLVNAMFSLIDHTQVNLTSMLTRLGQETMPEMTQLQERAAAADVAFFTLDTRPPSEGSELNNLEQSSAIMTGNLSFNPWKEMYDSTRGTLSALAYAGIYTLGYYRSQPWRPKGKVKVKIDRNKLVLDYDSKPKRRVYRADRASLDLVIGRPQTLTAETQILPLSLLTPITQLPLRPGAGGRGCEVSVFVQAIRPDGEIVVESFETVTIVLTEDELRSLQSKHWQHIVEIAVPRGPIRVRARVSDDRQEIIGDRSVDLTVLAGDVKGGLVSRLD